METPAQVARLSSLSHRQSASNGMNCRLCTQHTQRRTEFEQRNCQKTRENIDMNNNHMKIHSQSYNQPNNNKRLHR